jgi:hypothetical protein
MPSQIEKKILGRLPKEKKKPKNYKLLIYSFVANVVLLGMFMKFINKGLGFFEIFWMIVFIHIMAIIHEFGHFIVWRLKGVRTVDYFVFPMVGFGILPDLRALSRLQPLTIILSSIMGPAMNLAVGLYFLDIPGWYAWMFMALNLGAFASNFIPMPFSDGAYSVLHTFRSTMSVKLSFWRIYGIVALVLLFFLYWKHVILWMILSGIFLCIQVFTLKLRKETKLIYINAWPLEVITGIFIGLATVTFHQMFWVTLLTKLSLWWPLAGYYLGW